MRPEGREDVLDEVLEAAQRPGAAGGPCAVGWVAEAGVREIGEHLGIELVEAVARGSGPPVRIGGGRLAILGVEVPAPSGGLVAVHEVAGRDTPLAVEVLHLQRAPSAHPRGELVVVAQELVGAHDREPQPLDRAPHRPAVGLGHDDPVGRERPPVLVEAGPQAVGATQVDLEPCGAQLAREATHRGDDEVRALAVPSDASEQRVALDEEHPMGRRVGVGERADLAVELVAQHPHGVAW